MFEPPRAFNLARYFLDHNLEAGRGSKVALRTPTEEWTYARIHEASCRGANVLRELGVQPEQRVLLILPDRPEFAVAWFSVLRAGAVFAMVNPLLPAEDYEYYLRYTRCPVAIVDASVLDKVLPHARDVPTCNQLLVVGEGGERDEFARDWRAELQGASRTDRTFDTSPDDVAGWLFTSGSTGRPKAAVHCHRDFAFNTETYAKQVLRVSEADRTLSVSKLFFGYATGTNLMFPFSVGAQTCLFEERPTPETLFAMIDRFRPTILTSVPTALRGMLDVAAGRPELPDLSSLRCILSAGEALPPELLERWMRTFDVEVLDGIGSAEMFHIYITNAPGDVKPGSLGRLVPGYRARLVDPEGNDVPPGEVGTLHVAGGSTALWYHQDWGKSRETFHGEWCVTGDQFAQDADGYFWYRGRSDDLLKVGGIFVSPLEIEDRLAEHPAVRECGIVGAEDEGLTKPFAFVVLRSGHAADEETRTSLVAFLRETIARYKVPRWIRFAEDALPRNDRGKLDRKALRAEAARLVTELGS